MSADKNEQCQIRFGEGCADVDFDARQVTTTKGSKIDYDLLIGADGISCERQVDIVAQTLRAASVLLRTAQ